MSRYKTLLGPLPVAVTLLIYRLWTVSPSGYWRDWAAVLSLYSIYVEVRRENHSSQWVASSVMAYLLSVYVMGQLPHTLSAWGFLRP